MNVYQIGISTTQLRNIVAKASTIRERLNSDIFTPVTDVDEKLLQSRLDDWCNSAAKGDYELFQRFLAWDGLDLETAKLGLYPVTLKPDVPLPNWANILSSVIEIAPATFVSKTAGNQTEPTYSFLSQQFPLPFQDVLVPFVVFAQRELVRLAGENYGRLTKEAHSVCENAFICQLIDAAAKPLYQTFTNWRLARQSSFSRLLIQTQDVQSRELYFQFIQELLQGKLVDLFLEFAAMARQLAVMTELWIESQLEFLQHLSADWPEITKTFASSDTLGQVTGIKTLLSDPHRGRRSVIALEIEPNLSLIYKPKDMGIEKEYNQLLTWLNEQGCPLPQRNLQVLNCGNHGWVEYVEPLPCEDKAQLQRHYQRAGMLLCLTYVLDAIDCHHENVIACGEHPLLIDAETLMQHRSKESLEKMQNAQELAFNQINHSVQRTAFLPAWHFGGEDNYNFDFSGLGSQVQKPWLYKGFKWSNINTDRMNYGLGEVEITPPTQHIPALNGETTNFSDWIEAIAEGFELMYRFLIEKREALLSSDSPLWSMKKEPIRYLFRNTNSYFKIFDKLDHVKYLRDGVDRSIGLEILKRSCGRPEEKPKIWPLIQNEREQIEQLDIPFFSIYADTDVLDLPANNRVEGVFLAPSFDFVIQRIQNLSEQDLGLQLQLINATLYLRIIEAQDVAPDIEVAKVDETVLMQKTEITPEEDVLLVEIMAIADRLKQRAIHAPDGSVTWLAPQFAGRNNRFEYQPTSFSLYDGKFGIALFLAALEHVRGTGEFRELALGALQEFRTNTIPRTEEEKKNIPKDLNIGMGSGMAGQISVLTRVGQFLSDDSLIADALEVARLISQDMIAQDKQLDALGGAAGTILSLLALHRVTQDAGVLNIAVACGDYLLSKSVAAPKGRAWKTLNDRLITGYSHGAAGIAHALLNLAQVAENAEFRQLAEDAIAYEQSMFLPDEGNWPDLRDFSKVVLNGKSEQLSLMSSWCHGATGIGLSRVGVLPLLENEAIYQDIKVAIQTTKRYLAQKSQYVDHLCCGAMGQIEFLLCAAYRLKDSELLEEALSYAAQVVMERKQKGYYFEPAIQGRVYAPSLFRGETGVGYTLLHLMYPHKLPSILLYE
jgi:type 2 lantibiotic biosynthesis protein LanM